jgi:hypothetical protein
MANLDARGTTGGKRASRLGGNRSAADKGTKLDGALVTLTEEQIKTEERSKRTEERIDKLVCAIGESIRKDR